MDRTSIFFAYTKSGCRNSLVYHLATSTLLVPRAQGILSFSAFHSSSGAESTKTTWQLLSENRYNLENNLARLYEDGGTAARRRGRIGAGST